VVTDEARGADYYEGACAGGAARACGALAWTFDQGRGRAEDLARALELYTKACEAGDARSCEALGWAHAKARGRVE
jgi:TPR repeat protein